MVTLLQSTFYQLVTPYTTDHTLLQSYWSEIETQYEASDRYYHNLTHLNNMLLSLQEVEERIDDWEVILFSLFYHDIVYCATATDNEEQSALLAKARLTHLQVPQVKIQRVFDQILATKNHAQAIDLDTNYFLDADLSILGKDWKEYDDYAQNVRKEYAIYPDEAYRPGRKKALTQLLNFENMYKTAYFQAKFEQQARLNIEKEINTL